METAAVLQEIQEEISAAVQYRHEYRQGDLVITGNTYTSRVNRYHLVPRQHTRSTYLQSINFQIFLTFRFYLTSILDGCGLDNLAVGHVASPDTQLPPEEIGLRVMHRVTVAGKTRPSK